MTSSVTTTMRHRRASPCPICGGFDELPRGHGRRCSGFTNGDWCRCTREEHAGKLPPEDLDGGTAYRHLLSGPCRCGVTHSERATPYAGQDFNPGPRAIEATYDYRDEEGHILFQVVRYAGKEFRQRRPDMNRPDGWTWRLGDVRKVLYRLPELIASTGPVYIVEGEKDAETLRRRDLTATCNPGGAGKWHISEATAAKYLAGRDVVIVADRDDVGRKHANEVASHVRKVAKSVRALMPPEPHKDVTDHLLAGLSLDQLEALESPRPKPVPPPPQSEAAWDDEEPTDPDEVERPAIMLGHRVDLVVEALERHMAKLDPGLYQRAHELVVALPASKAKGIADGTPVIRPLSAEAALPRVTRHVQFMSPPKGEDKPPSKTAPTARILSTFVAAPPWPNIRHLVAVSESPIFRPDGSVRQEPGYDEETGYLFQSSVQYPTVPQSPTQGEARAALLTLLDVFADFPYATEESQLVPISAILSILARAAIKGPVPCHLFDATVMGSGKTLQCDVVHLIATGRIPAHATWPIKYEDQEKLLSTYANAAPAAVVLDNIKGEFGGSALEQTLTSDSVEFRQLGGLELRSLPWRTVVLASGNNVQPTDDAIRRILMSRLESPLENPTERTEFAHPELLEWVRGERPRLVASALTMLRAYAVKGFPAAGIHLASYGSYARLVASTIAFAGGGDVTRAVPPRERVALDDSGAAATLAEHLGPLAEQPTTLKGILAQVYPAPGRDDPPDGYDQVREAFEALAPAKGPSGPSSIAVGKKLSKFNGRWFGNRRIVSSIDAHSKLLLWQVQAR